MSDFIIVDLDPISAANVESTDFLALADLSAADQKKVTVADLATAMSISGTIADGSVTTAKLANGAVTEVKIADDAVTTNKIAANSVAGSATAGAKISIEAGSIGAADIATGAVTETKLLASSVTNAKLATDAVTNSKVAFATIEPDRLANTTGAAHFLAGPTSAAGGVTARTIVGTDLPAATTSSLGAVIVSDGLSVDGEGNLSADIATDTTAGQAYFPITSGLSIDVDGSVTHADTTTSATHNGITFNDTGHITGTSALLSTDLPVATVSEIGAMRPGTGLTVDVSGILNHASTVAAGTSAGITFDATGHITAVTPLVPGDLPVGTTTTVGAVSVPGTDALSISGTGEITHDNSGVTPGTYTKLTVDSAGHITVGDVITAADIPDIDASSITSGTFSSDRLAPNSVTAEQLADYGIAQVSESQPIPEFAGQWWINPSDRSAYIWVGVVSPTPNGYWLLVGYGSPTQLNVRFGGTYNATTNVVTSLNAYGASAGLVVGQALGAPNSANNGVYLVVTTGGTGTTPAPAVSLAIGDWVLSQGTGANWEKIAVVSGASGTFNDYDILCDGAYFTPNMAAVANVQDALELIWSRVQIATTSQLGVVKESSEVLVDNSTGEMAIGVVDDGTY